MDKVLNLWVTAARVRKELLALFPGRDVEITVEGGVVKVSVVEV